jgi:hypothetical protein
MMMKRAVLRVVGIAGLALACDPARLAADESIDHVSPDVAALAKAPMILLPFPPKWVATPSSKASIEDVIAEFGKVTSKPPTIYYTGRTFVRMDREWLLDYVRWFRKLGSSLNIRYEDQLFDCDKYSRCFVAFADLLARKGGETRGSICVGWALVFNDQDFAGITAGGAHSVVIIGTVNGILVIEPQNGTIVPLAEYPNRNSILAVYL